MKVDRASADVFKKGNDASNEWVRRRQCTIDWLAKFESKECVGSLIFQRGNTLIVQ